jgi:hypothetical protein
MENNNFTQVIECAQCGHVWILRTNVPITIDLYNAWILKSAVQHMAIQQENEKGGE